MSTATLDEQLQIHTPTKCKHINELYVSAEVKYVTINNH